MNWLRMRHHRLSLLLFVALLLAFTTTGTVLAQATANFDLGCRAMLTSGGGTIVHGATASIGALGQATVGEIVGTGFGLRSGYVLPIPGKTTVAAAAAPQQLDQNNAIYLPFVSKVVRLVRACQY